MTLRFLAATLVTATLCVGCSHKKAPTDIADPMHDDPGNGFAQSCKPWDDWEEPAAPFRIYGSTYYVGTCGIAVILIASTDGHVLIDSGTRSGAEQVAANVEALGFEVSDIRFLLHSHEHFDHVGGLAYLQELSGAQVIASEAAAEVLRTGIADPRDPQAGMHDPMPPVPVSRTVRGGDKVALGAISMVAVDTPGHTPGALSWAWRSCENDTCKSFVYADSLSPVSRDDYRFSDHPEYVANYRLSLTRVAELPCDFLLTPHPSSSQMLKRMANDGLEDSTQCRRFADRTANALEKRLAKESGI